METVEMFIHELTHELENHDKQYILKESSEK